METTTKALAWHGDPALKAEVMERLRKHREADDFIRGTYQRTDPDRALGYRGCAIGCTLPLQERDRNGDPWPSGGDGSWHFAIEELYGVDWLIANLIDEIFENLDEDESGKFALDVMDAVPVGADLTGVAGWAQAVLDTDAHVAKENSTSWHAAELIERLRSAPVAEN